MVHQRDRFWKALIAIGVVTILLGLLQIGFPGFTLALLGADADAYARHLLALLGVCFCLFGSMLIAALRDDSPQHVAVLWTGLFKLGMAILVGAGARWFVTTWYALALALFELAAAAMIIAYWFWIKQQSQELRAARSSPDG